MNTTADLPARAEGRVERGVISAGRVEGPRSETSLVAFLSILLFHRRVIALSALAGLLLAAVLSVSQASLYQSRASFIVKGSRAPQLPGAGGFGVAFNAAAEFSQSIVFYSDLVRSRVVLLAVAKKSYATSAGKTQSLAQIFGIKARTPAVGAVLAVPELRSNVSSDIYSRSGVVSVAATSTDPLVAQQIAANILVELESYSTTRQKRQAEQERKFVESLVDDARVRLDQAEQNVRTFLELNREYEQSPQLRLEHDRLTREVQSRQQIFTSLSQSLEQARIEEVRDPTAFAMVESPDLPTEPQRNEAIRHTLLGLTVGLLAGIVLAFLRQRRLELNWIGSLPESEGL